MILVFQSSPVLWDGRYTYYRYPDYLASVSILARPVGRALQSWRRELLATLRVSILARPVGRALHVSVGFKTASRVFQSSPVLWDGRYKRGVLPMPALICFNPRPSCGTGATISTGDYRGCGNVSILARPVGRALL